LSSFRAAWGNTPAGSITLCRPTGDVTCDLLL
jgi:hypothetical protein